MGFVNNLDIKVAKFVLKTFMVRKERDSMLRFVSNLELHRKTDVPQSIPTV
jgi:hypothetical protein